MIIFNREEEGNTYKKKDNVITQIESCYSLKEFTQRLQNTIEGREDGLTPDDYEAHNYYSGASRKVSWMMTDYEESDDSLYNHTFNPEEESGLDEIEIRRAALYEEFERYTYGQNHDFAQVPAESMNLLDLYVDCLDALGVMPTLHGRRDLQVKQMIDMSYMGRGLFFPWEELNASNRLPEFEDLEMFYNMTPYERAVITDSLHNPTRLMDIIRAVKAIPGWKDFLVTEGFIHDVVTIHCEKSPAEIANIIQEVQQKRQEEYATKEDYNALNEAFRAQFRRAPRILPEIYRTYQLMFGTSMMTAEQIQQIVGEFRLSNIQKIAGNHNPSLILLSGILNFDAVRKEHLQIFATYLRAEDYQYWKESGFLEWYEQHKSDVKTSDLCNIVKNIKKLHFDPSLSPQQLLTLNSQIRGWCNAACVYQEYGIDFRNAVVAIPNRGLIVEDKVQHIRMKILDREDSRVFTVGQDCHCCQNLAIYGDQNYGNYYSGEITEELLAQHFTSIDAAYDYVAEHFANERRLISGGAGASCVANELTNPLVWVTIWEDTNTGDTIAQADTHYVPETNTLVYDNIEFVNDGNVKKIYDIIAVYARESTFDSIHVGTGYNQQMKSFGKRIATKEMANYRSSLTDEFREKFGNALYSDYNSSAVKVKQNGEMLIWSKKPDSSFRIERLPEDNSQYAFLLHPVSVCFSSYSPREKEDLIARYEAQNLTEQELQTIAEKNPELLKDFETLPLQVQKTIFYPNGASEMNFEAFRWVRNPDSLLIKEAITTRPSSIVYFNASNTTEENWKYVLKEDGSLIEFCPKEFWSEELLVTAIKNNPFSIKYMEKSLDEPLRSKLIRMAIFKKPILTAHFPDLPEYLWIQICENKGQFGKYCLNQTYRVQEAMVRNSPYNIDLIRNPAEEIVRMVERKLPSIRTNPRYAAYFADGGNIRTSRTGRPSGHGERDRQNALGDVSRTGGESGYGVLQQSGNETIESIASRINSAEFSLDEIA